MRSIFAALLISVGLCSAAERSGPIVVGQTFIAASTDPRQGSAPWALVSHGIAEKLFTVDQNDDIVSQVGASVSKVNNAGTIWEVTLKSGYKFSDGTEVDASHVAACLNDLNKQNPAAQASLGSITATPSSDNMLLVRIESERPTHVMDAVLAEWVFVIYYIDNNNDFVYTGPYVVDHMATGDHIDLVPNTYYEKSDDRPTIEIKKFSDGHALAEAMKNLQIDVGFHLPIDTLPELQGVDGVNLRSFEVGYHYMAFHNIRASSPLSDLRIRKAVDLAIDRSELSQVLAGGRATRSLFPEFSPYYTDDSDAHGKQDEAAALLDEAGWELVVGKRMKNGEELIIDLVAYPHRPGLVIMQPVIARQLTDLGITVRSVLTGDDWAETQTIIDNADFDLLMWAQHTLPAGDPAWFLNSFFRSDGANNHAGFSSTETDSLLDQLAMVEEHLPRVAAAQRVHESILADVPVSNLVTPAWHVGLSDRVADEYEPWGSDYYVIRADTFLNSVNTEAGNPASGVNGVELLVTVFLLLVSVIMM